MSARSRLISGTGETFSFDSLRPDSGERDIAVGIVSQASAGRFVADVTAVIAADKTYCPSPSRALDVPAMILACLLPQTYSTFQRHSSAV
jgi:hypothetical protein